MIKRLDRIDVSTSDPASASETYHRNFDFRVSRSSDGRSATVSVGEARIHLIAGEPDGGRRSSTEQGMTGLWLEAEDLDAVVAAFCRSGLPSGTIRKEAGKRVLAVDPALSSHVPLFIFDRKV